MICGGLHDNYMEPPDIPAFNVSKRQKKENMSDVVSGAAVAICKALSPNNLLKEAGGSSSGGAGVNSVSSPSKVTTLRMKNYEQLKYLKQLNDEGVLNDSEYNEQKKEVMLTLGKL